MRLGRVGPAAVAVTAAVVSCRRGGGGTRPTCLRRCKRAVPCRRLRRTRHSSRRAPRRARRTAPSRSSRRWRPPASAPTSSRTTPSWAPSRAPGTGSARGASSARCAAPASIPTSSASTHCSRRVSGAPRWLSAPAVRAVRALMIARALPQQAQRQIDSLYRQDVPTQSAAQHGSAWLSVA